MTAPPDDLLDVLRQLRSTEMWLHALATRLFAAQPVTARAALVAHDAIDALIEYLEINLGGVNELVSSPQVESVVAALAKTLRDVLPDVVTVDQGSLRLAVRATLRHQLRVAGHVALVVPQVGPDGSILTPPADLQVRG